MEDEWQMADASSLSLEDVSKAYVKELSEFLEWSIENRALGAMKFRNGGRLRVFYQQNIPVRYEANGVHFERRGEEVVVVANDRADT